MSGNNTIVNYTQNYLLFNCKLKIKKHDINLQNNVTLKQARCICVSISRIFEDKTENNELL